MVSLEELKHKIHNTRFPIKDKRILFAVQCLYFITPVVLGCALMEFIKPDPEALRAKLKPTDLSIAMTERNKRGMEQALAEAEAVARRREAEQQGGARPAG
jgi:hypothetical protein